MVERGLATPSLGRTDRGRIYHLNAGSLYRRLNLEHSRHRRKTRAPLAARKLLLLDYVLAHAEVDWLATEVEKVAVFGDRLGLNRAVLPRRVLAARRASDASTVQYFPHPWPVGLLGDPPVPHFIVPVTAALGRAFEQFLADHAPLLRQLPAWTVVAIAPKTSPAQVVCQDAFRRFLERPTSIVAGRADDLRWYLATRRIVDLGEWARVSVPDLNRFRTLRARFDVPGVDALYREWIDRGEDAIEDRVATPKAIALGACRLVAEVLLFDYSQFGSWPCVA